MFSETLSCDQKAQHWLVTPIQQSDTNFKFKILHRAV